MTDCPYFDHLLIIPRLRVQNANALSSPLTHGFPSMTAFLGLMWALERKTSAAGLDLQFNAIGVVAHRHQEQITEDGFINTLRLTRNPINRDGSTAAIVEEGRIHLEISLVLAIQSEVLNTDPSTGDALARQVHDLLGQMRIAGGSVIPSTAPSSKQRPYLVHLTGDENDRYELFNRAKLRLLPGFVLVDRQDLLEQRHQALQVTTPEASKLDAWLSLSRINWNYSTDDQDNASTAKGEWTHDRENLGWIVPIPVGYGALSEVLEPGSVNNARDGQTAFRFVESLYGIGQWISPHRLHSPQQLLWYAGSQPENGLYRCHNDYQPTPIYAFD
ncbi:CRISPR-associated protein Csy2 [Pseudomonas chlororaphis subsp. aurantiaca]|uniref:type I-F CRISPR-associated protein Csy2 n=1 Tax=Pseudomonas chlororaphis TaxID=587753 RepID=UPI00050D82F7|nr:type I-F CRISPR-associated protein Csy2 [Pseudomonas chlororaphis]AIS11305.1 CRISPR-associated protein Csy2 [Pseudomonas chlororaphis subsp. aurantiaca]